MGIFQAVVAAAVGIVVGVIGMLVANWLKAQATATRTSALMSPTKNKGKASTTKCAASKSSGKVAAGTASPHAPKQRRGRPAKVSVSGESLATAPVEAVKKRRGRPTKAEMAARQASVTTGEGKAIKTDSVVTVKHASMDQDSLLETFLNLSTEQLQMLASMPVGQVPPTLSKEGLTT